MWGLWVFLSCFIWRDIHDMYLFRYTTTGGMSRGHVNRHIDLREAPGHRFGFRLLRVGSVEYGVNRCQDSAVLHRFEVPESFPS